MIRTQLLDHEITTHRVYSVCSIFDKIFDATIKYLIYNASTGSESGTLYVIDGAIGTCNLGIRGSNPRGGFAIILEDFMLKKIAVMFCVLVVGSTAVLFSSGEKEENLLDDQRSVSVVIRHCTS